MTKPKPEFDAAYQWMDDKGIQSNDMALAELLRYPRLRELLEEAGRIDGSVDSSLLEQRGYVFVDPKER